jgi:hypothetical protein
MHCKISLYYTNKSYFDINPYLIPVILNDSYLSAALKYMKINNNYLFLSLNIHY